MIAVDATTVVCAYDLWASEFVVFAGVFLYPAAAEYTALVARSAIIVHDAFAGALGRVAIGFRGILTLIAIVFPFEGKPFAGRRTRLRGPLLPIASSTSTLCNLLFDGIGDTYALIAATSGLAPVTPRTAICLAYPAFGHQVRDRQRMCSSPQYRPNTSHVRRNCP